jgi:hypothetical protein
VTFSKSGKALKKVKVEAMAEKKDRKRVIAEITHSHLIWLGNEQGYPMSREQALAFINQEGRAFEMWMRMMHAAEDFIACSLCCSSESKQGPSVNEPARESF